MKQSRLVSDLCLLISDTNLLDRDATFFTRLFSLKVKELCLAELEFQKGKHYFCITLLHGLSIQWSFLYISRRLLSPKNDGSATIPPLHLYTHPAKTLSLSGCQSVIYWSLNSYDSRSKHPQEYCHGVNCILQKSRLILDS